MTVTDRRYAGLSASTRLADRRAALREACLNIVGEQGPVAVSAEGVCRAAGLTKRYFYESFADRDALLAAILDDFLADLDARVAVAIDGVAKSRRPRVVIDVVVGGLTADARIARLFAEGAAIHALRERRDATVEKYALLLRDHVLPFRGPDTATPSRLVVARLLVAGATDAVCAWVNGGLDVDLDVMVEAMVDAAVAVARTA